MPVKSDVSINWEEIGKAAFPTLLPLGIAGIGWYWFTAKKDQELWYKSLKKPGWVMENPQAMSPLQLAVIAPIGYASHMICKEGRGTDRQIALGLYGAGLLTWAIATPAFGKTKDLKCWFGIKTLSAGIFGATAFAFYKINQTAGWLLFPLVIAETYAVASLAAMLQDNPNAGTDWTPKK